MQNSYQWGKNARYSVNAQVVGEELERIRERDNGLVVDVMLEEARPEDAPLHPLLTWDDEIAGENWRKHECRKVARSIQVIVQERPVRALHHVKAEKASDSPGIYQSRSVLVTKPDQYELAFKACCQRVAHAQQALEELKHIASGDDSETARDNRALLQQVTEALAIAKSALAKAA